MADGPGTNRRGFALQLGALGAAVLALPRESLAEERQPLAKDSDLVSIQTLLDHHWKFSQGKTINGPEAFLKYLKSQHRLQRFNLVPLPKYAVVLHDSRAQDFLTHLGYHHDDIWEIDIGGTDPNTLYFVYGSGRTAPDFILNRGLPGAGGITTQVAELGALGVEWIVHIGTCGLVGPIVPQGTVIVASGSYKDAAAVMLAAGSATCKEPISRPDADTSELLWQVLGDQGVPRMRAVGYTIPIFYFQPRELIKRLVTGAEFPASAPVAYVEMEQASFFEMSKQMKVRAASLVVGSDRYELNEGEPEHVYYAEFASATMKREMLRAAIEAFARLSKR